MKTKIYNIIIVIFGVFFYFIIFKYFFIKFDVTSLIHNIVEPQKEAYIGLNYLGYVYSLYSIIWIVILSFIYVFFKKNNKYIFSIYILIMIYAVITLYGLYIQFYD